jgi:hypothetical protein
MSGRGNYWNNAVAESFLSSLKKSVSESVFSKLEIWPVLMFLITSKSFTIELYATAIWVALVPRHLNMPQIEA